MNAIELIRLYIILLKISPDSELRHLPSTQIALNKMLNEICSEVGSKPEETQAFFEEITSRMY